MDASTILRRARRLAELSQREMADRAGLTASVIGDYERGRSSPTVRQLDRLLAAAGFQLETELVRRGADVDSLIKRALITPIEERVQDFRQVLNAFLPAPDGLPFVIEGAAAAALQGAPIPASWLGVAVPDRDDALYRLAGAITAAFGPVHFWDAKYRRWYQRQATVGLLRTLGPVVRWRVLDEEVRIRITEAADDVIADLRIVIDGMGLPVVGLWRLEGDDPTVAALLVRSRELAAELSSAASAARTA